MRASKRKNREPVIRAERLEPTPETVAKLLPDPVQILFDKGLIEGEHTNAAAEIRAIFFAIVGGLFPRAHDYDRRSRSQLIMPDALAKAHRDRYVPWAHVMGPTRLPCIIDALVDGHLSFQDILVDGLKDYAERMKPQRHTIRLTTGPSALTMRAS